MFGSQRGISQTPFLIVFIILFLGAVGFAYMNSENRKDAENALKQKQVELKGVEDNFRAKVEELDKIAKVSGYFNVGDEAEGGMTRSDSIITQHLELINKRLQPVLTTRQLTCKTMIDELARQIEFRDRKVSEDKITIENKDNKIRETEETKNRLVQEKQDRINSLLDDHQRNQQRLEQNIQSFERQVTDLRERIKNLTAENERVNEERRAEVQALNAEIKILQARVIALTKQEQIEETPMPDGRVTRADIDQGYAYIDLGTKDGVRSGQRFFIYSVLKGGRRKDKGEVRIIRVEKDFSQCSILRMADEGDPIVMGDYIWNKFFVPGQKLIFAFIGKFGGDHVQHTRDQLKKIVQDAGHVASDQVHADTKYVVLGEEYQNDPQFKRVQDWKIEKINPGHLFEYFGFGRHD